MVSKALSKPRKMPLADIEYLFQILSKANPNPKTELELHPNSPGYRLILNNVLFPAAKKKKQKT